MKFQKVIDLNFELLYGHTIPSRSSMYALKFARISGVEETHVHDFYKKSVFST